MQPKLGRPKNPVAVISLLLSDLLQLILELSIAAITSPANAAPSAKGAVELTLQICWAQGGGVQMVWEVLNTRNGSCDHPGLL